MIHSINLPSYIVWLFLIRGILGNMSIAIFCKRGCDVMNFEINLIFLMKLFFNMTKTSTQKRKYLENEELSRWNIMHFSLFQRAFNGAITPKFIWRKGSDYNISSFCVINKRFSVKLEIDDKVSEFITFFQCCLRLAYGIWDGNCHKLLHI